MSVSSSPGPSMDPLTPSPRLSSFAKASFRRLSKNPIRSAEAEEVVIGRLDRPDDDNGAGWNPSVQINNEVSTVAFMLIGSIAYLFFMDGTYAALEDDDAKCTCCVGSMRPAGWPERKQKIFCNIMYPKGFSTSLGAPLPPKLQRGGGELRVERKHQGKARS